VGGAHRLELSPVLALALFFLSAAAREAIATPFVASTRRK
jgi:hypothetical protein